MQWHNEPVYWDGKEDNSLIIIGAEAKTDFWRITHDGGARDNGHLYYACILGDFIAEVKVSGEYAAQYDQAGLMVRLDEAYWMKCGVELFNGVQQASVVVTREFSDWSVLPLPQSPPALWLRAVRREFTLEVFYSLNGENYTMLRQAYLTSAEVKVGPMAAAPTGRGFTARFEGFSLRPLEAGEHT